ncbi:hypothetical protein [Micromonospora sp. AMSO31t]|uniref:hypothetical protein n=1 Tax=Micromonospora sp. AMSO31t TaxID=2650566 RepID=UPI00124AF629|nr:hypothetical protein [Micromonospora sp. AMSO31t]KAB1910682.1 hypothetical protein F8274_19965 [Micromonospora sp. AMSO31t]
MSLSPDTIRRLAFIRYLHTLGTEQARLPEPLSSACVLTLQDAVESFLILATDHLGASASPNFDKYWEKLGAHLPDGVSLAVEQGMKRLNKARVNLKHYGVRPDAESIGMAVRDTATFMTTNTMLVFGLDYESVSMAHVVVQDSVRELVTKAEVASESGDRVAAMIALLNAFEELFDPHEPRRGPQRPTPSPLAFGPRIDYPLNADRIARLIHAGQRAVSGHDGRRFGEQIEALTRAVDQLRPAVRLTALGISFAAYQRFQNLTPVAMRFADGRTEYRAPEGYEPSSDEYAFCMQFVVAASLRLAELDANMTQPGWMPAAGHWGERPWTTIAEERRI